MSHFCHLAVVLVLLICRSVKQINKIFKIYTKLLKMNYFSSTYSDSEPMSHFCANPQSLDPTNRYVYFKQDTPKVLVNPHFKKTVFINPNFQHNQNIHPKIHINPNVTKIHINPQVQNIHVNPNVLKNISLVPNVSSRSESTRIVEKTINRTVVSTRTKIIRVPETQISNIENRRKRRSSIQTKYKLVKSSLQNSHNYGNTTKYSNNYHKKNVYKIDNTERNSKNSSPSSSNSVKSSRKKYLYINKFVSICEIAKNVLLKQSSHLKTPQLVNINGILYNKSPNSLKRATDTNRKENLKKSIKKMNSPSKYKLVRKSLQPVIVKTPRSKTSNQVGRNVVKQYKIIRTTKIKRKNMSPGKLRKCNIPCTTFRKYGKCKGKDNGTCNRKHDPDQIMLCTKFLQGACLKKKCLLLHNVSPEKMPTCKYYLEGLCSRDDCPYLHVRISPKADICRDFLEGYCKKAVECDKRHQFLCPDYEKSGSCPKVRCPYPHGNLVRKYSVFNNFAKKCSNKVENKIKRKTVINNDDTIINGTSKSNQIPPQIQIEKNPSSRYYAEFNNVELENVITDLNLMRKDETNKCDPVTGLKSRPQLGTLPTFIPLFKENL